MIRIKCFTSVVWHSYMENHITGRCICRKKAISKLGLGTVYTGEDVRMVPVYVSPVYTRHSTTYTCDGLFSNPQK